MDKIFEELNSSAEKIFYTPNYDSNPYLGLLYESKGLSKYEIKPVDCNFLFKFILKNFKELPKTIVHQHWFHAYDRRTLMELFCYLFLYKIYKIFGAKIVWTIHNEFPHRKKYFLLVMYLRKRLSKLANLIHVHGNSDIQILSSTYKIENERFRVFKHPSYKVEKVDRSDALNYLNKKYKLNLNLNDCIVLFFGRISKYKGINEIVNTFLSLQDTRLKLLVVGEFHYDGDKNFSPQLIDTVNKSDQINILPLRIEEEEVKYFFGVSDYVIFNFKKILTSGSLILAKSYGKRVIAPDKGNISEYTTSDDFVFKSDEGLLKVLENISNY